MKNIFLNCIIFLFSISLAHSSEKIVFIDIDYILNNSNIGKNIYKELEIINKKNIDLLTNKEKKIQEKKLSIEKMKNISSKEKIQKDIELFNEEVEKYRTEKDDLVNDFKIIKDDKLNDFLQKLSQIVENYMKNNTIDLVIEKNQIFLGNSNNDISDDILVLVNKEY